MTPSGAESVSRLPYVPLPMVMMLKPMNTVPVIAALIKALRTMSFSGYAKRSARLHIASQPKKDQKITTIASPTGYHPFAKKGMKWSI